MKHKFEFCLTGFLTLYTLSLFELGSQWTAILLILCGLILFASERRVWRPLPSVSLFIVAYLAGYAMPVLMYPQELGGISDSGMDRMIQWALRGFVVFSSAYAIAAQRDAKKKLVGAERRTKQIPYASFAYLVLGLIAVTAWLTNATVYGVGLTFIEGQEYGAGNESARQILLLFSDMKYAYILGYLLLRRAGHSKKAHFWLLLTVVALSLVEIMQIGSKAAIIKLLVVVILSVTLRDVNRLRWSSVLGGALAIVITLLSFSVITEYRHVVRNEMSVGQRGDEELRIQAFTRAVVATLSDTGPQRETDVDERDVAARFGSGAFGLGWILEFSNGISPYENAVSSIVTPFYAIVPRALWHDKPIFFNSGRFASDYFGWKYGGISISLLGSLYFAWGYPGILIGMAMAGYGMARLVAKIEQNGFLAVNCVTCLTILMLHMLDVGAEFQPVIVNITRALIILAIIRLAWRAGLRGRLSGPSILSTNNRMPES